MVHKVPSTPADLTRAVAMGLEALPLTPPTVVAHGSTVATNAPAGEEGSTDSAGGRPRDSRDVLQIGRQARHGTVRLGIQGAGAFGALSPAPWGSGSGWMRQAMSLQEISAEEVPAPGRPGSRRWRSRRLR